MPLLLFAGGILFGKMKVLTLARPTFGQQQLFSDRL